MREFVLLVSISLIVSVLGGSPSFRPTVHPTTRPTVKPTTTKPTIKPTTTPTVKATTMTPSVCPTTIYPTQPPTSESYAVLYKYSGSGCGSSNPIVAKTTYVTEVCAPNYNIYGNTSSSYNSFKTTCSGGVFTYTEYSNNDCVDRGGSYVVTYNTDTCLNDFVPPSYLRYYYIDDYVYSIDCTSSETDAFDTTDIAEYGALLTTTQYTDTECTDADILTVNVELLNYCVPTTMNLTYIYAGKTYNVLYSEALKTIYTSEKIVKQGYAYVLDCSGKPGSTFNYTTNSCYNLLDEHGQSSYYGWRSFKNSVSNLNFVGDPSIKPSAKPTFYPSMTPSCVPTIVPTVSPSRFPTMPPPTRSPTRSPTTRVPTLSPNSRNPTTAPTTLTPTLSLSPTETPSASPSVEPTTAGPTGSPSEVPSVTPTVNPTLLPSRVPSIPSTVSPTNAPSSAGYVSQYSHDSPGCDFNSVMSISTYKTNVCLPYYTRNGSTTNVNGYPLGSTMFTCKDGFVLRYLYESSDCVDQLDAYTHTSRKNYLGRCTKSPYLPEDGVSDDLDPYYYSYQCYSTIEEAMSTVNMTGALVTYRAYSGVSGCVESDMIYGFTGKLDYCYADIYVYTYYDPGDYNNTYDDVYYDQDVIYSTIDYSSYFTLNQSVGFTGTTVCSSTSALYVSVTNLTYGVCLDSFAGIDDDNYNSDHTYEMYTISFSDRTASPTKVPVVAPSAVPTEVPSQSPSISPSYSPTQSPTREPTAVPTYPFPTNVPSSVGWVTRYQHAGPNCAADSVVGFSAYKTNLCLPYYTKHGIRDDSSSHMFACKDGMVFHNNYNNPDCVDHLETEILNRNNSVGRCVESFYNPTDGLTEDSSPYTYSYQCYSTREQATSTANMTGTLYTYSEYIGNKGCVNSDLTYSFTGILGYCYAEIFNITRVHGSDQSYRDHYSISWIKYANVSYFYQDSSNCNAEKASVTEVTYTNTTLGVCIDIFAQADDQHYVSEDHSYELTTIIAIDHPVTLPPVVCPSLAPSRLPSSHSTPIPSAMPLSVSESAVPTSEKPTAAPTANPSFVSTLAPTPQTTFTLSFTASTTLNGLEIPFLDQAAQDSIVNATASSMDIDSRYVNYTGSTVTPEGRRGSVAGFHIMTFSVVAHTSVVIPMAVFSASSGSNFTDPTKLYTALATALSEAVESGAFVQYLTTASEVFGSESTAHVASVSVEVSEPTVVYPPTLQPTEAPLEGSSDEKNALSVGAMVGIVVGAVALLVLMLALWYYVMHINGNKTTKTAKIETKNCSNAEFGGVPYDNEILQNTLPVVCETNAAKV